MTSSSPGCLVCSVVQTFANRFDSYWRWYNGVVVSYFLAAPIGIEPIMNQIPSKLDRNYRCVPTHDKDNTSAAALKPDQIQLGFEPTTFGEDATATLQYWRCQKIRNHYTIVPAPIGIEPIMNQIPSKLDRNYRCVPTHDKDNTSAAALKPDQIQLGFEPTTFGEDATATLQYWRCQKIRNHYTIVPAPIGIEPIMNQIPAYAKLDHHQRRALQKSWPNFLQHCWAQSREATFVWTKPFLNLLDVVGINVVVRRDAFRFLVDSYYHQRVRERRPCTV